MVTSFLSVGCGLSVTGHRGPRHRVQLLPRRRSSGKSRRRRCILLLPDYPRCGRPARRRRSPSPAPAGAQLPPRRAQPAPQAGRSAARHYRYPRGRLNARQQPPYTVFRLVCARLRIAPVAAGGRIRRGGGCCRCGQAPEQVPLAGRSRTSFRLDAVYLRPWLRV